jgi:hypothetical protein
MRFEWKRSLTESSVESPAIPIDPPMLRIMLKSADATLASGVCSFPAIQVKSKNLRSGCLSERRLTLR